MSKHTKGPWTIKKNPYSDEYINISNGKNIYIGSVNTEAAFERGSTEQAFISTGMTKEVCAANARLIASSPDLLEALKQVLEVCRGVPLKEFQVAGVEYAKSVLAKATGGGK